MMFRGHYIEYHSKDHLSYIKKIGTHKWGVWFEGEAVECPPTRSIARGLMHLLKEDSKKETEQSKIEIAETIETYREVHRSGCRALETIPGVYILIGRLSERLQRYCRRTIRSKISDQLLAAQKEAEVLREDLDTCLEFLKSSILSIK